MKRVFGYGEPALVEHMEIENIGSELLMTVTLLIFHIKII